MVWSGGLVGKRIMPAAHRHARLAFLLLLPQCGRKSKAGTGAGTWRPDCPHPSPPPRAGEGGEQVLVAPSSPAQRGKGGTGARAEGAWVRPGYFSLISRSRCSRKPCAVIGSG